MFGRADASAVEPGEAELLPGRGLHAGARHSDNSRSKQPQLVVRYARLLSVRTIERLILTEDRLFRFDTPDRQECLGGGAPLGNSGKLPRQTIDSRWFDPGRKQQDKHGFVTELSPGKSEGLFSLKFLVEREGLEPSTPAL